MRRSPPTVTQRKSRANYSRRVSTIGLRLIRHQRRARLDQDRSKHRIATSKNWTILRWSPARGVGGQCRLPFHRCNNRSHSTKSSTLATTREATSSKRFTSFKIREECAHSQLWCLISTGIIIKWMRIFSSHPFEIRSHGNDLTIKANKALRPSNTRHSSSVNWSTYKRSTLRCLTLLILSYRL